MTVAFVAAATPALKLMSCQFQPGRDCKTGLRVWLALQAYIAELATLLVQLGSAPQDTQLRHRLDQVTFESSQLMGIIKPNLKVHKAVLEGRLDEGRVGEDATSGLHPLDSQWYARMPVGGSSTAVLFICLCITDWRRVRSVGCNCLTASGMPACR